MRYAQLSGNGTRAAGKMQRRPLARLAPHLQFLPRHAMLDARTQRLGSGFFRGKTRGKTLRSHGSGAAIGNFFIGKHALHKALAEAFQGARDARHFDQIDARSDQHDATVAQQPGLRDVRQESRLMDRAAFSDGASVRENVEQTRARHGWDLSLTAICSDDAPRTVRFLTGAVMACGGYVLSRRFDPGECAAIEFEFVRATCVEMYSILIAAGLELSAQSHR